MFKYAAICLALGGGASVARANLIIDVGSHPLLPDLAGQKVSIYVVGDVNVIAVKVECQIEDGGPLAGGFITGPTITDLDVVTGTIFAGNNNGQSPELSGVLLPQLASRGTITDTGSVLANGLLATLTIDTTGFSTVGQSFALKLRETVNGSTVFGDTEPAITNGTLYLANAVPEPAALPVVAAGAVWLLGRRRARSRPAA